jgi:hypothetical protein
MQLVEKALAHNNLSLSLKKQDQTCVQLTNKSTLNLSMLVLLQCLTEQILENIKI